MRSPADFAYMRDALLARYPIPDAVVDGVMAGLADRDFDNDEKRLAALEEALEELLSAGELLAAD